MAKIIISYRRSDSDAIAGRIRDRLAVHFGDESLFMDIDNVPFGIDFRDHIKGALLASDVVIVIIGPKWLGPGKGGRLRIKDETDPVRIEVETALQNSVPLIPVLVNGATMPTPAELPDTLKDFAFRNAAEVETGRDFNQHMDRLIRALVPMIPGLQSPEPRPERQTLTPEAIAGERNLIKVSAPPPPAVRTAHGEPHRQRTTLIALASAGVAAAVVAIAALVLQPQRAQSPAEPIPKEQLRTPPTPATPPVADQPPGGCSSNSLPDERRPPQDAFADALKKGITPFFECPTRRYEQMARGFASLSIVIAHYAPSPSCFAGDPGAPGLDWLGHKGWADRQGHPDLLLLNMRAKIDFAINCMKAEQQLPFFADMARSLRLAAADPDSHEFNEPTLMGQRIDRCLFSGRDCDAPAATTWCKQNGFIRATRFTGVNVSPTYSLGDRITCPQGCAAFATIACVK